MCKLLSFSECAVVEHTADPLSPFLSLVEYDVVTFLLFLLTHFPIFVFVLAFLNGKSIFLLAADAPAGQDVGVTEAETEPRVAGWGVSHVQGDWLVAIMEFQGGHQKGEVEVKVGPFGVVPEILRVEVQDPLPGPA